MAIEGRVLFHRKSMNKFQTDIRELEVCEWATWHPCYLNRYLVTLLEHLGVPSSVFIALQSEYVDELSAALKANQSAERLLMSLGAALPSDDNDDNDDNAREQVEGGAMRAVLEMLRAGVSMDEPFLAGVLRALQAALLRDVVQRARVLIKEGTTLMGVMDEEGVLEYGEVFIQVAPPWAHEEAGGQVIDRQVIVYRSPQMHPSQVLTLSAVDRPELHHLKNVIVFPGCGRRPHPLEMGGDLDGDKFQIIWNPSVVCAVTPVADAASAASVKKPPQHKKQQQQRKPSPQQQPATAHTSGGSSKPPKATMPSERLLLAQTAASERQLEAQPKGATLADFVGAASRRHPMSDRELGAQGTLIEWTRQAQVEEKERRFQDELRRRVAESEAEHQRRLRGFQRRQEAKAMQFYLFFAMRNNLGQISNKWLQHADELGVDHPDTLELCSLAEKAIQFVKTGEPVVMDEKRFACHDRPDFMALRPDSTRAKGVYASRKALGLMYRAAIAATAPPTTVPAPDSTLVSLLLVDGHEAHLPRACAVRGAFDGESRLLQRFYGVATEGELLSGHVASFSNNVLAHENPREVEESLRREVRKLWRWARSKFQQAVHEAEEAATPEARQGVARLVASAWYAAGRPALIGEAADADARMQCSFAWVAWPELLRLLREMQARLAAPPVAIGAPPDLRLPFVRALKLEGYGKAAAFEAMDRLDIPAIGWSEEQYVLALKCLRARPEE
mmetsp:Transcript_73501/g.220887  ORF Transcript_73501/g.220887 Transcript_73501/m.220887 type:complete len:732 (-) Transcript_73501:253-2448(-)